MKFSIIFYSLGRLLFMMGGFLLLPAAVSFYYHEQDTAENFILTAIVTLAIGLFLSFKFKKNKEDNIGRRDGFLLVTLSWLLMSFFGAFPFYLSPYFQHFTDAFFESTSGFSTTGASILTDIEILPHGLLFWRSFTHWIGGMGIIVLAVAILPQLSVGGMQLMNNETPGPTFEQLKPRIKQTAMTLWKVYVLFSVIQLLLLWALGMSFFDSICHMFGTMGTGGFSTKNESIAAYSPQIQMVITFFMFVAGTSFILHYRALKGEPLRVTKDAEWKFFFGLVLLSIVAITINLLWQGGYGLQDALRLAAFQVAAISSTTGYATDDFNTWPYFSKGILFLFMIVGGCAGSTSGGMKQVRFLLLLKKARQGIMKHIFPKAIIPVRLNGQMVSEGVLYGVSNFLLIYGVITFACSLFIMMFNIDFVTSLTSVIACLSNIGPGYGMVGAAENYAFFPMPVKYLLMGCMIIGRLEIYTVLVLFFATTWRK